MNALLCISNIMAAFYISKTIMKEVSSDTSDLEYGDTSAGSMSRIKQVLLYDAWVAIYIVIKVAFIIWLFLGLGWLVAADGVCSGNTSASAMYCISLGFSYFGVGTCAFTASLCCVRSRARATDYHRSTVAHPASNPSYKTPELYAQAY